jgi:UDP-N-acetylmuramoyl-tripeptide--D-alanyl-D-alanine ligase
MSMLWSAEELVTACKPSSGAGFDASGVSIDTRTLKPGDLFVALVGEARDGHDFVASALAKGAAGALISRDITLDGNFLRVEDTLAALTRLGAYARARSEAKVVAVTGSVGKTTTKEMLRRVLASFGTVHAADASFNNHIGVPLTLARMPREIEFAVLEIGMNHPGEIFPLARLARPHVAIITNIERAHIGLMGSIEAIAAEKAKILLGLEPGGTAILPGDSAFVEQLGTFVPVRAKSISFGGGELAEARLLAASSTADGCNVTANIAGAAVNFHLAAPGAHMAMNAIATLAACHALGLDTKKSAAALDGFVPFNGRGVRKSIAVGDGAAILLDESYNASGASMRAALAVLGLQPGRHVAVLGDMLELGDEAIAEHRGLAPDVVAAADIVFTCGPLMKTLFDILPPEKQAAHAADAASIATITRTAIRPGDAILVKGSYGSRMRDVIAVLEAAC